MSGLVHVEPVMGTAVTIDMRWRDREEPVLAEDAVVAGVRLLHEIDPTGLVKGEAAREVGRGHRRASSAVDPHSGPRSSGWRRQTVVGPDLAIADALATAATAAGATALDWLDAAAGYEALLVLPSGEVRTSAGWSETPLRCRAESTDSTR